MPLYHSMYTLLLFLTWFCLEFGYARANIITATQFLRDPETLVSSNTNFKLGFFGSHNSTNRYVGIWYNIMDFDTSQVVWVANRETPLSDSSGSFKVSEDGNLQVLNGENKVFWSSNVSYNATTNPVAQLVDSGNLVLFPNASGGVIVWQSFDHLIDSLLPPVKRTIDENMYGKPFLQSWKSPSDPSIGHFSLGISGRNLTEVVVWGGDNLYWRSGPWTGNIFLGLPYLFSQGLNGFELLDDHQRCAFYITYAGENRSVLERYVVDYEGRVFLKRWGEGSRMWEAKFQSLGSECDVYGKCGAFGGCNPRKSPMCGCLKGFKLKKVDEWSKGNWTSGCVRTTPLQCGTTEGQEDGFLRLGHMKVPDDAEWLSAQIEDDCRSKCLRECSCLAYAFYEAIGCMFWNESLIDMQEFPTNGVDLFIRLAHSELGETRKWITIIVVPVIIGTATLIVLVYYLWRWIGQEHARKRLKETISHNYMFEAKRSQVELDLPLFKFETLLVATSNFDYNNKLG